MLLYVVLLLLVLWLLLELLVLWLLVVILLLLWMGVVSYWIRGKAGVVIILTFYWIWFNIDWFELSVELSVVALLGCLNVFQYKFIISLLSNTFHEQIIHGIF